MKGLFIPEITSEMFRNGCLESIEQLMAEGEIYDIDYPLEQDPCEDCISRAEAIKALEYELSIEADGGLDKYRTVIKDLLNAIYNTQKKVIEDLPSIQPKPKTGHWIDRFPAKECKCSVCDFLICISNGTYIDMVGQMKYCPNCGAKMVEPQESDHKCHTCKHYTSGEHDGSCGSYICKEYSNWESEDKE